VDLLQATIRSQRADGGTFSRLLDDPALTNGLTDAIIQGVHLLPPADQDLLSKFLFDLVPSAVVPSPPPNEDAFKLLANIQRQNRKDPTYGGFFLPCLELLVRVPDESFREQCRAALLRMLTSNDTGRSASERRRFAATSLAGILGFYPSLLQYAQAQPP
jgi:hypothetical protein